MLELTGAALATIAIVVIILRRRSRSAVGRATPSADRTPSSTGSDGRRAEHDPAASAHGPEPMAAPTGVPPSVGGRYRIEEVIARGGTGAVYRARDARDGSLVAVKVVHADLLADPDAQRRFLRGAATLARLRHPSIVAVRDSGVFEGGAYLAMELVRGEDLRRRLQREGRIDVERAIPMLSAVCAGIEAAHREGVLHLDLKPENILLPTDGAAPKVLDFGVAATVVRDDPRQPHGATPMAVAGTFVGTPAYMAPEQFHAAVEDARTDVFSLGVIAYEVLSGALPFGRGALGEIAMAQARGARPLPADLVPAALDRAVRAALEIRPERRPASAQAFAHLMAAAADL
jgi:serine/threonine-protein kinase